MLLLPGRLMTVDDSVLCCEELYSSEKNEHCLQAAAHASCIPFSCLLLLELVLMSSSVKKMEKDSFETNRSGADGEF
jgi:hypothetical protein